MTVHYRPTMISQIRQTRHPDRLIRMLLRASIGSRWAVAVVGVTIALAGCGSTPKAESPAPAPVERTPPPVDMLAPARELADLAWMIGCWSSYDPQRLLWTEECWSTIVDALMLGTSRTVRDGKIVAYEQIRIYVRDDLVWYVPSPGGRTSVSFLRVTPTTADRAGAPHTAVFENLDHDFPKRIIYRGDGESFLEAIIDGDMAAGEDANGRPLTRPVRQRWFWHRSGA